MNHSMRSTAVGAALITTLLLLALSLAPGLTHASDDDDPFTMRWELFSTEDGALRAVFWLEPAEGYYTYANAHSGDTGLPTTLEATASPDSIQATVTYPPGVPKPDYFDPDVMISAYKGPTPIFVDLAGNLPDGTPLTVTGNLSMLLCSAASCWPVHTQSVGTFPDVADLPKAETQAWNLLYQASMPESDGSDATTTALNAPSLDAPSLGVAASGGSAVDSQTDEGDEAPEVTVAALGLEPRFHAPELEVRGIGKAILLGLLAGFILNFMPCVLPVVGLKLSTLMAASSVEDEQEKLRLFREHNIFFALGVLCYFLALSLGLALLLQTAGLAWGSLFQNPTVVLGLAVAVFTLGLSLFGVFDLPMIDLKGGTDASHGKGQALFTGMLATLLATPCSGPLLGGVLGWTLVQPPYVVSTVFVAIGIGMGAPYLVLAAFPGLVKKFPRPGDWTIRLERFVAFFLMGTTLYLIAILPTKILIPALVLLLCVGFAAWIWGSWTNLSQSTIKRFSIRALAVAFAVTAWIWLLAPTPPAAWEPFRSTRHFQALLGEENLLVDFTADWCPTCKVLEKSVMNHDNLARWAEQHDLRLIQVDMTESDPEQEALLAALGSRSIPVVALFPAGVGANEPLVLRDLFTTSQIEAAMDEAFD